MDVYYCEFWLVWLRMCVDWEIRTDGAWGGRWCGEVDVGGNFGGGDLFIGCCEWHFELYGFDALDVVMLVLVVVGCGYICPGFPAAHGPSEPISLTRGMI